jgi:predicted O-methyltransferase YrrM
MARITNEAVEAYMRQLLRPRDAVLVEMEAEAAIHGIPIVGPLVGQFLYQLALLSKAGRIFEMGSAIGYSTIWWARAVKPGGKVYYSDGDPENAAKADDYLTRAGVRDRVEILVGNSLDLIEQIEGDFDIVFNDVDKHYYPEVHRKAAGRVRVGGLFVTDNTLRSGRVADRTANDPDTVGVRESNRMLYEDDRYCPVLIPLRDGVGVGLRVK